MNLDGGDMYFDSEAMHCDGESMNFVVWSCILIVKPLIFYDEPRFWRQSWQIVGL